MALRMLGRSIAQVTEAVAKTSIKASLRHQQPAQALRSLAGVSLKADQTAWALRSSFHTSAAAHNLSTELQEESKFEEENYQAPEVRSSAACCLCSPEGIVQGLTDVQHLNTMGTWIQPTTAGMVLSGILAHCLCRKCRRGPLGTGIFWCTTLIYT